MTEYSKQVLTYSVETQRAVNNLPYHHKIRRERASVGQCLLNALLGTHTRDIRSQLNETLRDKYLSMASLDQPDTHWTANLGSGFDMATPEDTINLLKNSSFEVWTNQLRLPDWWEYVGVRFIDVSEEGIIGERCIEVEHPGGAAEVSITQQVPQITDTQAYQQEASKLISLGENPFKGGIKLVASLWYKTEYAGTTPTDFDLVLSYLDRNNNLGEVTQRLVLDTGDRWRRAEVSLVLPVDCAFVYVSGVFSGFSEATTVLVDAFQLEIGETATKWQPYALERPFYQDVMGFNDPASAVSEYGVRGQYVESVEDFWYNYPTRTELVSTDTPENTDPGRAGFVYEIDFWKDTWTLEWIIDGNFIRKMGIPEEAQDQYGRYVLAPYTFDGYFEDDVWDFTYHALTYFQQKLWAVATAVDWKGRTRICLCVVDPLTPWPEPSYLETPTVLALADWPGGTPVRLEFKQEDQQHIYITTAHDEYCYRLYHDYFMLNAQKRQVYFRENYGTVSVVPVARLQRREALTVERR